MSCPHYKGKGIVWEGRSFIICSATPGGKLKFRFACCCQDTERMFCLSNYPNCRHYKKSKEVTHE